MGRVGMCPAVLYERIMLDFLVIGGYLAAMMGIGFLVSRKSGEDDFFLAGRSMPAWSVALSVVATALSAATFVGVPQLALTGNLTYLATYIGALAATVLTLCVIPALYALVKQWQLRREARQPDAVPAAATAEPPLPLEPTTTS